MAKPNPKLRVSQFFALDRDQTTLDFVDVPIGNDIAVFLDPSRIRSMETSWAAECNSLLQHFFQQLLDYMKTNDSLAGMRMLEGLSERNEFHLGLSRGKSQGSGIGREFAKKFWKTLNKSKASKTGLLKDLEDACLFIDGVGNDRISDAACNATFYVALLFDIRRPCAITTTYRSRRTSTLGRYGTPYTISGRIL